jgi:starch synthase (maltosyl-transferring)
MTAVTGRTTEPLAAETAATPVQAGPRIYAIDAALAGGADGMAAWLAHAAGLGFDHVLLPAPFPTSDDEGERLVADHAALAAQFGGGTTAEGLARLAGLARQHGLVPLMDVAVDRIAASGRLLQEAGAVFSPPDPNAVLDPRHGIETGRAAHARIDDLERAAELGAWWGERLATWHEAGIAGFRLLGLANLPGWALAEFLEELRRAAPACRLFAWTPGLAWESLPALAAGTLDGVFPSLPWWDWRSEWIWDEMARLASVAPLIACPEAPGIATGTPHPPLVAAHHTPEQGQAAIRRAVAFAAGLGQGWMLPGGLEFGLTGRAPRQAGSPEQARTSGRVDLAAAIAAANAARQDPALERDDTPRLATGPGAPVLALLRTGGADPRAARRAALLVVNTDLDRSHDLPAAPAIAAASGRFPQFASLIPADGEALAPGIALTLAPGEVRLLAGDPVPRRIGPANQPQGNRDGAERSAREPRVGIEDVTPRVEGGNFAVKRVVGETVTIEADAICDGHDQISVALQWRGPGETEWREIRMRPLGNDRYAADLPLARMGRHVFTIEGWRDAFASFRDELGKKHKAGVPIHLELREGQELVQQAAARATGDTKDALVRLVQALGGLDDEQKRTLLLAEDTAALMRAADDRPFGVKTQPFMVEADRTAARFASWYEVFPRSMSDDPNRHGNFDDVIRHLPRVQAMGFDVLYFPPIHPIGRTNRKGRNNTLTPAPDDPGSPYAIGSEEGGHDALHPELGTLEDFRRLIEAAREHGLEIAIDFAIQCSPDHPWLRQHKEWFDWRPDGTIKYAENPPKKYEDIVNVDFYAPGAIPDLWLALCNVVLFWAQQGVRIFRVDNPHTKPLPFWRWMIGNVRVHYPDAIFLAEAFTRPKVMYRLAKLGFTQSYTYFTWRNTKAELTEYLTELSTTAPREFFRPNFFVNTPDINPVPLQTSGRGGYLIRACLAATLSGLWGVYNGFELTEGTPLPGREEYADSEKYQIRAWDWDRPGNITAEITALNRIRRMNPALQTHLGVTFLTAWNDMVMFYEKATEDRSNVVLVAVSLDPKNAQEADIELPLWRWKLSDNAALAADDLIHGNRFTWHGKYQHIRLTPDAPYAIWRVHPAS